MQLTIGILLMSTLIASIGLISQRGVGLSNNAFAADKILYDDFSGAAYALAEGQTSPNGKWLDEYNGRGAAGVKVDSASGQNIFFEQPRTGTKSGEKYGAKVVSTQEFGDANLSIDVRTDKQLRSKLVKPWDTAWIMFRHADSSNYYYFMLKTNGYELGKKDSDIFYFLQTGSSPQVTLGKWQHLDISTIGNRILISVNGDTIIDYTDSAMSQAMKSGAIGLYSANAAVSFDNIYVTPVTPGVDSSAPSIVAPADITVEAKGLVTSVPNLGTPTVHDSVDSTPTVTSNAPAGFPLGATIVTWTVSDDAGNKATDIQVVTVRDTTTPALAITSPSTGSYTTESTVLIRGTSADAQSSGVHEVTVKVDSGTPVLATPVATGDWSSWSIPVNVSADGSHTITAYVEDNAANTNTKSISVSKGTDSGSPTGGGSTTNVYDNFEAQTYWLNDGGTSPDGKWKDKYNGYGVAGVITDSNGNNVFYAKPKEATGISTVNPDQSTSGTHAALILSTTKFKDYKLSLDMRTDRQLRATDPNTWEVAWIMFNYVDSWHHHYFTLKTNGYELGKKDNTCQCEAQIFLKTGTSLKNTLGTWYHLDIYVVGNHITIYVDGTKIIDMYDTNMSSYFNNGGSIGMYTEDAEVRYDNVTVTPL